MRGRARGAIAEPGPRRGGVAPDVLRCPGHHRRNGGGRPIPGTFRDDAVSALGGNDVVYGRGGDDRLCGGRGRDVLHDGPGSDLVDGGDGIDLLYLCPDGDVDRWRNVERVIVSTRGCG